MDAIYAKDQCFIQYRIANEENQESGGHEGKTSDVDCPSFSEDITLPWLLLVGIRIV